MAILFCDSFDHYATAHVAFKWSFGGGNYEISTSGRNSNGLYLNFGNEYIYKTLGVNTTEFIFGCAFKPVFSTGIQYLIRFMDSSSNQLVIGYDYNTNELKVFRDTTLLGTSSEVLTVGVWYFIELKAKIDNSTGYIELRINHNTVIDSTGIDTQNTSNAYFNRLQLQYFGYFDDLYLLDTNGSTNNDFLGDITVKALYVNSSGTYAQWQVTGSASNYLAVDDATPDDDSTYTYATGSSLRDSFSINNLSIGDGEIYGIQTLLYARKDEAGAVLLDPTARINGTDYTLGTGSFSLSDSYTYYRTIEEMNPDTSGSWTLSDVDNMEIGYTRSG